MNPNNNVKSATTAGLLGIFLGAFGAHNWYLGEKSKGIAHVCMVGGGFLVFLLAAVILPSVMTFSALYTYASIFAVLDGLAWIAIVASGIWGLVEGIIVLSQGDAGLVAKGYAVAMPPMNNYGPQGYNPNAQGYNVNSQGYNQNSQDYNPGTQTYNHEAQNQAGLPQNAPQQSQNVAAQNVTPQVNQQINNGGSQNGQ